ncbi:hypothetical protein DSUL_20535 [Desulfovibrionales bacterium]
MIFKGRELSMLPGPIFFCTAFQHHFFYITKATEYFDLTMQRDKSFFDPDFG